MDKELLVIFKTAKLDRDEKIPTFEDFTEATEDYVLEEVMKDFRDILISFLPKFRRHLLLQILKQPQEYHI